MEARSRGSTPRSELVSIDPPEERLLSENAGRCASCQVLLDRTPLGLSGCRSRLLRRFRTTQVARPLRATVSPGAVLVLMMAPPRNHVENVAVGLFVEMVLGLGHTHGPAPGSDERGAELGTLVLRVRLHQDEQTSPP